MCAILGFSTSSPQGSNINALNTGIYNLRHRGPDNTGLWISEDECLGMAHSRLSIIDLSSKANQPMANDTHDLIIGFNGEIYNFIELRNKLENQGCSFATNSDTGRGSAGPKNSAATIAKIIPIATMNIAPQQTQSEISP